MQKSLYNVSTICKSVFWCASVGWVTVWQVRRSVSKVWLHKRAAAADRMELNPSSRHAHSALHSTLYTAVFASTVNTIQYKQYTIIITIPYICYIHYTLYTLYDRLDCDGRTMSHLRYSMSSTIK